MGKIWFSRVSSSITLFLSPNTIN